MRRPVLGFLALALLLLAIAPPAPGQTAKTFTSEAYGKLPISFEPNVGQKTPQVGFVAHGRGYELFLTRKEAVLSLCQPEVAQVSSSHLNRAARSRTVKSTGACSAMRLGLSGANSAVNIVGMNELPGKSNYFIGNDPGKWRTGVPTYAQIKYEQVYSGVDLVFYGNQRQLEYDFRVAPHADPSQILLSLDGASSMKADPNGHLRMGVAGGEVQLRKPIIYQETNGIRQEISGRYILAGGNKVRFEIGPYDHNKMLVVDPAVDYSTYLGGSSTEIGNGIAVDSSGDAFVAGLTSSTDFPTTANAIGGTNRFTWQGTAFVTEINPAGTAVLYSTYIGGTGGEQALGIALDSASPPNVYITGWTCSGNFPTTSNAYMPTFTPPTCGGYATAFVTKFNPALTGLSALKYSTYLGGNTGEIAYGIAVDGTGNIYVTGNTSSSNFPTTTGAFQTANHGGANGYNGFVSRFDPTKSGAASLIYSTYLGGTGGLDGGNAIAVDSSQNAYVTGGASSVDFPTTASAFMKTYPAGNANGTAFVARINTAATGSSSLVYSTFLGGGQSDYGNDIVLGPNNVAYITGNSYSTNFPVTAGAYRTTAPSTNGTGFLSLVDTSKSGVASLAYSTYFGGSNGDSSSGVAADSAGNAYLVGSTNSTDFPITSGAYQTTLTTCSGFASELIPAGNGSADLVYSTFYDGTESASSCTTGVTDVALDSTNNAYITGQTGVTNFPVTPSNAYQTALKGSADSFVAKLTLTPKVLPTPTITGISPNSGLTGASVTITGTNFGATQGTSTVKFNGTAGTPTSWSATSIVVPVPSGATTGNVVVTLFGLASNGVSFTVLATPSISSLNPTSGAVGTSVTITGTNFGSTQGTSTVKFNGTTGTPTSWSATSIVVPVPSGATTGSVVVTVGGVASNGVSFTVPGTGPTVYYYLEDSLGSSRVITTNTGVVCYDADFTPFGGERAVTDLCTQNNYKFTGKERDGESGLDNFGARYFGSSMGRFMSPDPSSVGGDIVDAETPQAWNMYSYVLNNPLNATDPDGLDYWLIGGNQCGQNKIQCDKEGYVLDNNGNRTVITDQQLNGSNGLAKFDENGNLIFTTSQGTFQGQFFDPNPVPPSAIVTADYHDMLFDALVQGTQMARPGVNAAAALQAPQLLFMGGATVALSGAGSTLTLEAGEIAASPGEVAELSQAATQGGKAAVRKALRSYAKRLAKHQADLARYRAQGGYTSSVESEIKHFQTMIRLAEDYLSKNP